MRNLTFAAVLLSLFISQSVAWGWGLPELRELVQVARFKTEFDSFNELLLTSKGNVLLVQSGAGHTEAWDVPTRKRLWQRETDIYAHRLSSGESEFLWLNQQCTPAAVVQTDLRTGKDRKRTPLKIVAAKLLNAQFATDRTPLLAAQYQSEDGARLVTFSVESGDVLTNAKLPLGNNGEPIAIGAFGVARDGSRFLLTVRDGLLLCDARCKVERRFPLKHTVSRICFLSGGKQALAADLTAGSPISFLDFNLGTVREVKRDAYGLAALTAATDRVLAVSGGRGRTAPDANIDLWFLRYEQWAFEELRSNLDGLTAVAVSADGTRVAAADANGSLVVYEIRPVR